MAYATLARFKEEVGSDWPNKIPPGMKGSGNEDAYITRLLNVAASEIDRYLARGRLTVPVDVTEITDATLQTQAADTLAYWNVRLAQGHMPEWKKDEKSQAAFDEIREELEAIAEGKATIPGLPGASTSPGVKGIRITGGPGYLFKEDRPFLVPSP